jgi:hypothetical protein
MKPTSHVPRKGRPRLRTLEGLAKHHPRYESLQRMTTLKRDPVRFAQRVKRIGEFARAVIDHSNGDGYHILVPLTRAWEVGEYMRGMYSVLAPRARVTLLVTPKSDLEFFDSAKNNLRKHLLKCLGPHSQHIRIADDFTTGRTVSRIRQTIASIAAEKNTPIKSMKPDSGDSSKENLLFHAGVWQHELQLDLLGSGSSPWKKLANGSRAMDPGNLARFLAIGTKRLAKKNYPQENRQAEEHMTRTSVERRRRAYLFGRTMAREYLRIQHMHEKE